MSSIPLDEVFWRLLICAMTSSLQVLSRTQCLEMDFMKLVKAKLVGDMPLAIHLLMGENTH